MRRVISTFLLFIVVPFLTACLGGGPPKVWVLGDSNGQMEIQFDQAPRVAYLGAKTFKGSKDPYKLAKASMRVFMMDKEGDYTINFKNASTKGKVTFNTDDAFSKLTIVDPMQQKYIALVNVGSIYSKGKKPAVFPIVKLEKPAQVHRLEANAHHTFWWSNKLPSSLMGVSVAGSEANISAYKLFALTASLVEGVEKEKLAQQLTQIILASEKKR
ncbi:MAG: hypothetical protein AAF518_06975 [Spirochaetota bacterium]